METDVFMRNQSSGWVWRIIWLDSKLIAQLFGHVYDIKSAQGWNKLKWHRSWLVYSFLSRYPFSWDICHKRLACIVALYNILVLTIATIHQQFCHGCINRGTHTGQSVFAKQKTVPQNNFWQHVWYIWYQWNCSHANRSIWSRLH